MVVFFYLDMLLLQTRRPRYQMFGNCRAMGHWWSQICRMGGQNMKKKIMSGVM